MRAVPLLGAVLLAAGAAFAQPPAAWINARDLGVRSIVDEIARPVTTYGFNEGAQVRAVDVRAEHGQMHFTVRRRDDITLPDLQVVLNLAGEHNVRNALAAIAVAVELNVPDDAVLRALAAFKSQLRQFLGIHV